MAVENCKPVIDRLDQINNKQNAKRIATFDFRTIYAKLPDKELLQVVFDLTEFILIEAKRKYLIFR